MSGTRVGGVRASETNKERYGENFYSDIGRKGGSRKGPKGFALMTPERRRELGSIGGAKSRRPKK